MKNVMTTTFNFRSLLKTVICLAFLFGCASSAVFACSCAPGTTAFLERSLDSNLIVIGKVTGSQPVNPANPWSDIAISLEVQRILKGDNTVQNVTVKMSGLCGFAMPVNSNWVFALNSIGVNSVSQVSVSICTKNYLYVQAGQVIGQIHSDKITRMRIPKFIKSLRR